jgi:antitoxin VapB
MTEAKLFKVGGSQAVRLPKEFRFSSDRVRIRKDGDAVILEPVERTPADVLAWLERIKIPDFMADGREQPPPQERGEPDPAA